MSRDDPDHWDREEPRPVPDGEASVVGTPGRSPYSPSRGTRLVALVAFLAIVPTGLLYTLRYPLGLSEGSYAFIAVQHGTDDQPVTYRTCEPLTYSVNDTTTVEGGRQLVDEAVARIASATGLQFQPLDGDGSAGGSGTGRSSGSPPVATVVITWSDPAQDPELAGDTVGVGGSSYARDDRTRYFRTGQIRLDTPDLARMLDRHGPENVRAVIMHELGHVVGLDHVDDRHELMNKENVGRTDFGPGDLEGLALLGQGGCEAG